MAQARCAVNSPRRRASRPVDLLLAPDALDSATAAAKANTSEAALLEAAAAGRLPLWVADISEDRGWVFHPAIDAESLAAETQTGVMWVPNLDDDIAVASAAWATEQPEARAPHTLLSWLRTARPDPMTAERDQFAWWCCAYRDPADPDEPGGEPSAATIAVRWAVVSRWYRMLTDSGIAHNDPAADTAVAIVRER